MNNLRLSKIETWNWREPLTWIALGSGFFFLSLIALLLHISLVFPLVIVFGVVASVLLFRAPLILLSLLFIVRMSLDYSAQYITVSLGDFTLTLSQILGIGIAGLGIVFVLLHFKTTLTFPLLFSFLLVTLWGLFTLTYSISQSTTLYELIRFFNLFVIGLLAFATVERYRDFRILLHAIFLSSIIPILFGLYQFVFHIGLQDENVDIPRIFGTFSHPNVYSLFLFALIALTTLYLLIYAKSREARMVFLLYLVLLVLTLVLTYARIAWIALFAFFFLLSLWRFRFLLIPIVLFPLILIAFSTSIQDRVGEAFHPTPDSSITWRKNLWHDMLLKTEVEHRQLLGSGMDTFRISSEELRGLRFGSNDPHNDFVKFYVEGGVVGVAILTLYISSFLYFILKIYRKTPSHSLRTLATIAGFVILTLLLASLSDNVFKNTPVQWILWTLLGGLLALYHHTYITKEEIL